MLDMLAMEVSICVNVLEMVLMEVNTLVVEVLLTALMISSALLSTPEPVPATSVGPRRLFLRL